MNDERRNAEHLDALIEGAAQPEPTHMAEAETAAALRMLARSIQPDSRFAAALQQRLRDAAVQTPAELQPSRPHHPKKENSMDTYRQRIPAHIPLTMVAALVAALVGMLVLRDMTWRGPTAAPIVAQAATATPQAELPLPFSVGAVVSGLDPETLERMDTMGLGWISVELPFTSSLADSTVTYANHVLTGAHAQGLKVAFTLVGTVSELQADPVGYRSAYASMAGRIAALGADAIQVWREPNIDRWWPTGEIDAADYVRLLSAASDAIREANPDTRVIAAAPVPTRAQGDFGGRIMDDDVYYAGMAEAGAAEAADCVGVQYVQGVVAPDEIRGDPRDNDGIRYLTTMIERAARPFRETGTPLPLCFMELGYLSLEGLPGGQPDRMAFEWAATTTAAQQGAWIAQALEVLAARSDVKVDLVILYALNMLDTSSSAAGFSLVRPDGSCPGCEMIAALRP